MPNPVTQESLINLLKGQARSADMWIAQWESHKDASAMRNAAMAIGKIHGIYNVLIYQTEGFDNVPEEVISLMAKYTQSWDSLYLA